MGHCTVKEHYLWSSLSDQADVRLRGACLTMVPQILLDGSDVYELYVKRTVKPQNQSPSGNSLVPMGNPMKLTSIPEVGVNLF